VLKKRQMMWSISRNTTRISGVNGSFDAPSGTIKARLPDCPPGGMHGNAILWADSGENIVPLEWLESYGYCIFYLASLGAIVVTPNGRSIQLERDPVTNLYMIDVDFCYMASEANISLSTSILGGCVNGVTFDMDEDNLDNHVGIDVTEVIYSASPLIPNEIISTLMQTNISLSPWPSLALRSRFAQFQDLQEVETLIIYNSSAFFILNPIYYADDVIVTSEELTMRTSDFEYWRDAMREATSSYWTN
jgi:hypothetical protein